MIRVLLADDHPPLRIGLRILLEQAADIEVVAEAVDGPEALRLTEALRPHLAVLDYLLPGMTGAAVAAELQRRGLPTRVLALSSYDNREYVHNMLRAGAVGYLLKSEAAETIVAAVRAAEQESYFSPAIVGHVLAIMRDAPSQQLAMQTLTPREREVLQGLAQGWTNARIAEALTVTDRTVAAHVESILNKLGASNRTEAVVEAIRRGWVEM